MTSVTSSTGLPSLTNSLTEASVTTSDGRSSQSVSELDAETEADSQLEVETEEVKHFLPPSLPDKLTLDIHDSYTYHTGVPSGVGTGEPCILGVDEAGRGPVLGPMVYALAYCPARFKDELAAVGFADSKVLSHKSRTGLLQQLCEKENLGHNVGWATATMTARDIATGMLRPEDQGILNLNQQAYDTTMALIQLVLDAGVQISELYVDTVGPPAKYQARLQARFPTIANVTVAKKADSLYPIVSAASICAKVTRDAYLVHNDESGGTWGSGYPSDPKTAQWLKGTMDRVFGWGHVVRYSWKPTQDALEGKNGVLVEWADELARKNSKAGKSRGSITTLFSDSSTSSLSSLSPSSSQISTRFYGQSVQRIL